MSAETLRVVLGAAAGTEIPLDDTFTLGRTETGHGSLGGDPELSRQHARIARTPDGGLAITDLNSTNGTYVNGVRIAGSQRLNAGDTVRVGQTTINVHVEQAADADRTVIGAVPQGAPPDLGAPPFPAQPASPPEQQQAPPPPPAFEPPPPAGQPSWEVAPPAEEPARPSGEPPPPGGEPSREVAPPAEEPARPWWEAPPRAEEPAQPSWEAPPAEEPARPSWEAAPPAEELAPSLWQSQSPGDPAQGAGAAPVGEVPLPPSPQPPAPGPGPGPPAPPTPDPAPPAPGPEPGPGPGFPGPSPGPPGAPPGPGPQIEHQPGPFGDPPIQEPPPAGPVSPHGDPPGAPAGMTSSDPLGAPQGMSSGDPLGGAPGDPGLPAEPRGELFGDPPGAIAAPGPPPGPSDPPEGTAAFGPPASSEGEATRFDAGSPSDPPPLPAAASVPQPAAPPPFAAPPAPPIQEHGTQRYEAAAPAYAQPPAASPDAPAATGPAGSAYELKRPVGRQVVLYAMSFGLWGFYWFYDTRKKLNGEMGKPDDAGVKTACMLIPIYNFFLIYQLWDDLNTVRTHNYRLPELNVAVLLVVAIIVPFGVFWAYPKVANALNEYWDHRTQGQATEAPITGTEKVLAGVGLAFLVLYLVFLILIVVVAASGG